MRPLPRLAWFYIWLVALSAGAVLLWFFPMQAIFQPDKLALATLCVLTLIVTETHQIPLRYKTSVTVSTAVIFAGLLILDVGLATWATAIGMGLAYRSLRRRWYHSLFNTAAYVWTVFTTSQIYRLLDSGTGILFSSWANTMALILAGFTYFLINSALVSIIIDLRERQPLGNTWVSMARGGGAEYLSLLLLGGLGALVYDINKFLVVLLIIPVVIVYDAYKNNQELRVERDRLIDTEETVRKKLQMELHDGLAQSLAAMVMKASVIGKLLTRDAGKAGHELASLETDLRAAMQGVRSMLFDLRPLVLEAQGLVPALQAYSARVQQEKGLQMHLDVEEFAGRMDHRLEISVFGVIQEAVNNIVKHAQAKNVWIKVTGEPERFQVIIRDDGRGFDVKQVQERYTQRGSFGLLNMQERASRVGGDLQIDSQPGQGTTVTLSVVRNV